MPWLRSSANKVETDMFCSCLIVQYGVALHCTCCTIFYIVPWCPAVYKTSTASIQLIPFCFSELLISFTCHLKLSTATKSAWDFFGGRLIFGPGNFFSHNFFSQKAWKNEYEWVTTDLVVCRRG